MSAGGDFSEATTLELPNLSDVISAKISDLPQDKNVANQIHLRAQQRRRKYSIFSNKHYLNDQQKDNKFDIRRLEMGSSPAEIIDKLSYQQLSY